MISPLLAILHYAFDMWMRRNFPDIPFERYADDAICHCRSEDQAMALRGALDARLTDCGLTLHPDKTKIVYCRDESRRGTHPVCKFDFLGYTFRPRLVSKRAGGMGVSFSPATSPTALKAIRGTIRSWSLHRTVCCGSMHEHQIGTPSGSPEADSDAVFRGDRFHQPLPKVFQPLAIRQAPARQSLR